MRANFVETMPTHTLFRALLFPILSLALTSLAGCATPDQFPTVAPVDPPTPLGMVERKDPRLDKLIAPDAKIEKIAEGFAWCEGPVWVSDGGYLLFSDIPRNMIFRWKQGEGVRPFMHNSGYTGGEPRGGEPGSNGLTIDNQGRLCMCEHGDRRVSRTDSSGGKAVIADHFEGKRFNSPNDLCFDSKGNLYFTDPPYGLVKNMEDPAKELTFQGVYRVSADGKLTLLTDEMSRPNGIALSPDEKTLYVANSDPEKAVWMAYDLKDNGTLANGRVFFDATDRAKQKLPGLPDGMKIDKDGNLFAGGPGGIYVFTPDGTHLGTISTGDKTANCAWGDDGSTLYLTSNHMVCRIKTLTKGRIPGGK